MAHYGTVEGADAYHEARGNEAWTSVASSPEDEKTAALIRATAFVDGRYLSRFPGVRTEGRSQDLQWPRIGSDGAPVTDAEGNEIADDEVPAEIISAVYEAALREIESPGSLMPDLDRGGKIKSLTAGSVAITYMDGATAETVFTAIDAILAPLLGTPSKALWGFAARA